MSWSRRVRHSSFRPEWDRPHYEPSKRRLTWPNGAIATTYSADEPERLRGPQHDAAWCDEIASWRYPEAWDMLMFGLRLGDDPRVVVTTTPKPIRIIRELIADPTTVITRGSRDRSSSRRAFLAQITNRRIGLASFVIGTGSLRRSRTRRNLAHLPRRPVCNPKGPFFYRVNLLAPLLSSGG